MPMNFPEKPLPSTRINREKRETHKSEQKFYLASFAYLAVKKILIHLPMSLRNCIPGHEILATAA